MRTMITGGASRKKTIISDSASITPEVMRRHANKRANEASGSDNPVTPPQSQKRVLEWFAIVVLPLSAAIQTVSTAKNYLPVDLITGTLRYEQRHNRISECFHL